jgi:hypothetical protein
MQRSIHIQPTIKEINMAATITLTNQEFLEAIAGDEWRRVPISWGENSWWVRPAGKNIAKPTIESSNYFTVSLFKPAGDGKFARKKELFERQFVFVIDDVGTKLSEAEVRAVMPPATYELETSPGNWQYGYRLTNGTDARALDALICAIVDDPDINPSLKDPGMKGVTRVARLPVGSNNKDSVKAKNGGSGWPHRMKVWSPEIAYSIEDLAFWLGVDLGEESLARFKDLGGARRATAGELEADPILKLFDMKEMLLDATPNDNGFVSVICPWAAEHSDSRNEAGYRPGSGGFQCHHGHCESRNMNDLRAWVAENVTPAEQAQALAETFGEVADDDPMLLAEVARARARQVETIAGEKQAVERKEKGLERWVYIKSVDRFGDLWSRDMHARSVFNSIAHEFAAVGETGKKAAASVFLNGGGRIVDDVDYAPGEPSIFVRTDDGIEKGFFNTWRPGPIVAHPLDVSEADIGVWLDHVKFVLPDPTARDLFLDWCAYLIQTPGGKINWAYVLTGGQGIGKDMMLSPVMDIIGRYNRAEIRARDIESQWTWWAESQVIVLEELPPYHKKNLYEDLKSLVSVAQGSVVVNKKGIGQYYIRNIQNWIIFSNHSDALALEEDDRRYFIYASPAEKRSPKYYRGLAKAFQERGFLAYLAGWLIERDLAAFDPGAAPPMTEAKRAMIDAARDPAEAWIAEQFEDGGLWCGREIVRVQELVSAAKAGAAGFGGDVPLGVEQKMSQRKISDALRKHGFTALDRKRLPKIGRVILWVKGQKCVLLNQVSGEKLAEEYHDDVAAWSARCDEEMAEGSDKKQEGRSESDKNDPF